ncbi:hypothetical protein [Nocardiopsis dassonvillei]|uniref:hypothetical protein n=1 Tax=Nocardiopsis dassonvillei TaxID=2014 RepID=UPI00157D071A|nr:hypothetical protein [Nocardiopsis dassonvillei]
MAYAEKLVKSWRACWYVPGKKTPEKLSGFATKREARQYAEAQEAEARRIGRVRSDASQLLFRDWAQEWIEAQDLEPATLRNYRSILRNHLIRVWGEWKMTELAHADNRIAAWRRELHENYAETTINLVSGVFSTLCADAVSQGIMPRNPAARPRRRGRQAPKRQLRQIGRYEAVTGPLGAWLIAERAAALAGRDDEFVMLTAKYYLSLRLGELLGLEKAIISRSFRLERQLTEGEGRLYWKGVKSGSERTIDVPPFLLPLLDRQARRVQHPEVEGKWCPCGEGLEDRYRHIPGIHLFTGIDGRPHWKSSMFRDRYFHPAARGLYYAGSRQEAPVYQRSADDPFSFVATGQGVRRPKDPEACWAPICPEMKPHGLRHSLQALIEEKGVPKVLVMDRMGHAPGRDTTSVYSHVTPAMREHLVGVLQEAWESALEERRAMGVESPVGVVRELLEPSSRLHSRSTPDVKSRLQTVSRGRVA